MKRLVLKPIGWQCTLEECPAGLFVIDRDVGFKSEYKTNGKMEIFCESGEFFWGGTDVESQRKELMVQPVESEWEDNDEI